MNSYERIYLLLQEAVAVPKSQERLKRERRYTGYAPLEKWVQVRTNNIPGLEGVTRRTNPHAKTLRRLRKVGIKSGQEEKPHSWGVYSGRIRIIQQPKKL